VLSVAPEAFAAQMAELERLGMRGTSLREAIAYRGARGSWPAGCAVLTFDDGYANLCESLPVLRKHGFTASVFVVSAHVGGSNDWAPPPARLGRQRMLSWGELGELAAAGVEIGAHTRRHADLRRLSAQETEGEIVGSRREIEARLNLAVESFAYPFGGLTRVAYEIVGAHFRAAVTTVLRRAEAEPLHALPRIDMNYVRSAESLRRTVHGERDIYLAVRRWGRRLAAIVGQDRGSDSVAGFLQTAGKR
jgi:peptidoglycan/xylan/chitin deacetylase (PgdA/CDA1 family)